MLTIIPLDAHNPSPLTGLGNTTYLLIADRHHAALIDTGIGDSRHLGALERELSAYDATLEFVVVTHAHADHASGAASIAAAHPSASFYKYPWPAEDVKYRVPWQSLHDGAVCHVGDESLLMIHTPGHSPDHLVVWHEPTRAAFTGDLVIPGSSVMIHTSGGGDLRQYLASLERVQSLAPAMLLPAHGPRDADAAQVLTSHLEHRRQREDEVLAALASGHDTVQSIAECIYDGLASPLMGAAKENVLAHLLKLKSEGRAVEHEARWHLARKP